VSGRKRLSSAALLILLAGCATMLPAPRQPISPEARQVIERLEARWREFSSFRTLADVAIRRGSERHQVRGAFLAKAPASVRFEALSPMGQPLLLATVHDGRLTAFDATTNEGYAGPATSAVTARFLSLPFEPDDLVGMLVGRPVPPLDVRTAELLPPDEHGASIEMHGTNNRRRIWLDPATGVVRKFELTGGRAEVTVLYVRSGAGEIAGFDLAASLNVVSAVVRYQNPAFGEQLAGDAFSLTLPKGAKIQEIR
jgi:outer membrane lipoprotein-sorting protein